MKDHPKIIEKRHFTCRNCGYNVQVHGEMYFDYGCYNYIATFSCNQCLSLFEFIISKMEVWNMDEGVTYNLGDEPTCLNCGTNNNKVWNKESGKCPKCSGEMDYIVVGQIKVRHSI